MSKVVCVLYDDPVDGYPTSYARDTLPKIDGYPDGQRLPTPKAIDFKPGALLGSVSDELEPRREQEPRDDEPGNERPNRAIEQGIHWIILPFSIDRCEGRTGKACPMRLTDVVFRHF